MEQDQVVGDAVRRLYEIRVEMDALKRRIRALRDDEDTVEAQLLKTLPRKGRHFYVGDLQVIRFRSKLLDQCFVGPIPPNKRAVALANQVKTND